ncbi:MAG: hypothetical protein KGQ59_04430 [Bdellovibrionales bacterium]|nr:hypothetical protein [Bdellovibrionales bacterium]
MKLFNKSVVIATLSLAVALPLNAQAFTLKLLESRNVADANYCGDFNKLRTYELGLTARERLPSSKKALLSSENLKTLEKELRENFITPKEIGEFNVLAKGIKAIKEFGTENQNGDPYNCFREDFGQLFSFEKQNGRLKATDPQGVTYLKVNFRDESTADSTPAVVVIDRRNQRLYIHQVW